MKSITINRIFKEKLYKTKSNVGLRFFYSQRFNGCAMNIPNKTSEVINMYIKTKTEQHWYCK